MSPTRLDDVDPKDVRTAWRRLLAFSIDALLVGTAQGAVCIAARDAWPGGARVEVLASVCFIALSYWIVLHALFGQTVGKWVARVRLVGLDLRPVSWIQAIVRDSASILLTIAILVEGSRASRIGQIGPRELGAIAALFLLNVAWILLDVVAMLASKRRRALHDRLARTVIVRVGKGRRVADPRVATT